MALNALDLTMAQKSKVKVPKTIMGTKIPKDIRKDVKRLIRSIEKHGGVTGLVAMAVATWLMSKLNVGTRVNERDPAIAH